MALCKPSRSAHSTSGAHPWEKIFSKEFLKDIVAKQTVWHNHIGAYVHMNFRL